MVRMERKSCIVVCWKSRAKWEAYSSLVAFVSRHPQYTADYIYNRWSEGVFADHRLELRRVQFILNRRKTRRGNVSRVKPGPARTRNKQQR